MSQDGSVRNRKDKIPMPTPTWTTATGQPLKIRDIDDNHLRNIARMLIRSALQLQTNEIHSGWQCLCMVQGEAAEYAIQCGIDQITDMSPEQFILFRYAHIFNACKRRKIAL